MLNISMQGRILYAWSALLNCYYVQILPKTSTIHYNYFAGTSKRTWYLSLDQTRNGTPHIIEFTVCMVHTEEVDIATTSIFCA
jgi:hypothetical protein